MRSAISKQIIIKFSLLDGKRFDSLMRNCFNKQHLHEIYLFGYHDT